MPWLTLPARLVLHHPFDLGIFLQQIEAEKVPIPSHRRRC